MNANDGADTRSAAERVVASPDAGTVGQIGTWPALADGAPTHNPGWDEAVAAIRASDELREAILRSVMSSMAIEGFEVDHERSAQLLDEALNGPPLNFPADE